MAEKRPFRAYSGREHYIFASYSHADGEKVYAQLDSLFCAGYNIWYDQGIPNNSVLDRQIETAIERCSAFVVFLSPNSAASKYVGGKELPLARKKKKPLFFVRLSEDDSADYSDMTGGSSVISCDGLIQALPASCRECMSRKPQPIEIDTSNGFYFDSNSLLGIEYHLIGSEAVIETYNNLGAVNDVKELSGELYVPDTIAGYPVTGMSSFDAFDSMYETEWLCLPESLTVLGNAAFAGSHVPEIWISTRTKLISAECFSDSAITGIYLPYGLESIGDSAFEDCAELEDDVLIPGTVTYIGDSAFSGCNALETVIVPPQVTYIGADAFDGSTTVYCVKGSPAHRYAKENELEYELISEQEMEEYQSGLRESTERTAEKAVEKRLDIGETAEDAKPACIIADEADIPRIETLLNDLKTDGISYAFTPADPEAVKGYAAAVVFLSAANIAESGVCTAAAGARSFPVMLDSGVKLPKILGGRFIMHANDRTPEELYGEMRDFLLASGCKAANLRATAAKLPYKYYFCDDYLVDETVGIELHEYSGGEEKVTVPSEVLHLPVEKLDGCFKGLNNLREVEVSGSVRNITSYTFRNCPALKKVIIPPTVEEIDECAFDGCPSVVIYAERRSPAYRYAKKNGIKVKHMRFTKNKQS